ncbi:non-ribosomal peptide synthetase [Paenibacillus xylaniclasticus]|uniref:non-ribosomal peptide synthetase n=1 Tax=Paenibacillus xylaniclasticus TaxID=588083 RepID=UPI000FDBB4B1|nr:MULTISPECIES: non-ribosomal peptide synthetase [Paenibacillus]GFN29879.1 plipastatin synthase subunit C [Paenibacillus curdlanolyticus]
MKAGSSIEKIYPLAPMQAGMVYHWLLEPQSTLYFEQTTFSFEGDVRAELLEASLNKLAARHQAFRSNFLHEKLQQPVRVVFRERTYSIRQIDFSHLEEDEQMKQIEQFKHEDRSLGFDLSGGDLMRVALLSRGGGRYELVWSYHHIVMDGWSVGTVLKDWFMFYEAALHQSVFDPPAAELYERYVQWLQRQDTAASLAYWNQYLKGYEQTAEVPSTSVSKRHGQYVQREIQTVIGLEATGKLTALAQRHRVTLNTVLQTVWGIVLQKYNNTDDVVFGSVVSGRSSEVANIEAMVGLFINTIPVRIRAEGSLRFDELIETVQEEALKNENNSFVPLSEVQGQSDLGQNLIQNIWIYENYPIDEALNKLMYGGGLGFTTVGISRYEQTNYDFNIVVLPSAEELVVLCSYNENRYAAEEIERILGHFVHAVSQVIERPDIRVQEITLLSEAERRLLESFNTVELFPQDKTIQQLFEEQVQRTPDSIAIVFEEQRISYAELNAKANRLAHRLRDIGAVRDGRISLLADRSIEMVVGILAVLKAGSAYVPLDPEYPDERLAYMLADSGSDIMLVQPALLKKAETLRAANWNGKLVVLGSEETQQTEETEDSHNPSIINEPSDLAYIIYTSGSTGKPKGVMVEHKGIANVQLSWREHIGVVPEDRIVQFASSSFDASVWEIFMSLLTGAELYIPTKETVYDAAQFVAYAKQHKITVATLPPTYLSMADPEQLASLRVIITAGSAITPELAQRTMKYTQYRNAYGPSESTICTTIWVPEEGERIEGRSVSIGKPIANLDVYVIGHHNQLQPIGAAGELCISGVGVARGYLNRPELTAEKFIDHPLRPDERMYRTGDLVRWLPDGNLEYLGRIDTQVKIRGFRIEPGEIENELQKHPAVREAAVVVHTEDDGMQSLCAYVAGHAVEGLDSAELRAYLGQRLPDYMIPSYFVALEQLPLNLNGKVDRKALPSPKQGMGTGSRYEEAATSLEAKLIELWQQVLGRDRIGVHDHFFELGGHSLKATALASAIHKQLDVSVPLKQIFRTPTVRELARYIERAEQRVYRPIENAAVQDVYPVSSAQKRLLVLEHMEDGSSVNYNIPMMLTLEGELDASRLERALQQLVDRHESLRTSFAWLDGEPVQRISENVLLQLERSRAGQEEAERRAAGFVRPFDLGRAPLLRAELIEIVEEQNECGAESVVTGAGYQKHVLLLDMHHAISDGVSIGIMLEELSQLYAGSELAPLRVQYKDYTLWQQERVRSKAMEEQRSYWLKQCAGDLPVLDLPTDFARPAVQQFTGDRLSFTVNAALTEQLNRLAQQTNSTLYTVLLAAYQVLLARYAGQSDVIVGTPLAGRLHSDTERMLGLFVNTLAIRAFPEGSKTVEAFLAEMKETVLGAHENQEYPFEQLVSDLNVPRDLSRNPLFSTVFALQNVGPMKLQLGGVEASPYPADYYISKFDLSIEATEHDGEIQLLVEYATHLFKPASIDRMMKSYMTLLHSFCENRSALLSDIPLVPEEERALLNAWNDTRADYPSGSTIQQLFEEQAERTPDATAVAFEDQRVSYADLNRRANRLARTLRGDGTKQIVGLLAERSVEMVVGILAILKAGGAYVPIDPEYPDERIVYMLADSGAGVLLAQPSLQAKVEAVQAAGYAGAVLALEEGAGIGTEVGFEAAADAEASSNLPCMSEPTDLAYIIYTSGSTGKPKGVMLEHRGIASLRTVWLEDFGIGPGDRVVQFASSSFDASVWEMFMSLLTGAELHIPTKETIYDVERFVQYAEERKLTVALLPPTYLSMAQPERLAGFRIMFTGGSAITPELAERVGKVTRYINAYGPSEATIVATLWDMPAGEQLAGRSVPIGRPIANTETYILGPGDQLQPIGVAGELCIGGVGVARGYMNRPELTAEKFVDNPFRPGERMYKTGDLARWLPDGTIEYMGRIDTQVKIRGYRIEPGEIENELQKHTDVREAVVVVHKEASGEQALCAYIAGPSVSELGTAALRAFLSMRLPDYMIPAYFVAMEQLPLNHSGKVDLKALPAPEQGMDAGRPYEEPASELEARMAEVWQEVLGRERIGAADHFFELGGDSIKGIQVCARLYKHGWKLEMKQLFKHPVMRDACLQAVPLARKAEQGIVEGEVELLPIQRWFFEQQFEDEGHWNQAMMLQGKQRIDADALERAAMQLVCHHDALRTVFRREGTRVQAYIRGVDGGERLLSFERVDYSHLREPSEAIAELAERTQSNFDLANGPLLRVRLIHTKDHDHVLLVAHHLVIDGVSWRIVLEDLAIAYEQAAQGEALVLADKTDSTREWAAALTRYATSRDVLKEVQYWQQIEQLVIKPLPQDHPSTCKRMCDNAVIRVELDGTETALLLEEANRAYNTEIQDILLTALARTLQEWMGESSAVISVEGHGREDIVESAVISRTVGWFTSMYPVMVEANPDESLGLQLKRMKEMLRQLPSRGIGYGILRYLTPAELVEGTVFSLKPEISFNYLGQFDKDMNSSLFEPSPFGTGETIGGSNHRMHELDIVGLVQGGCLTVHFNYDSQSYRQERMKQAAATFERELRALIAHCTSQSGSEATPSDLGDSSITLEELEAINNLFA